MEKKVSAQDLEICEISPWNFNFSYICKLSTLYINEEKWILGNKIGITIYSWTGWYLCRIYNGNCECKCLNGGNGVELNFAMFGTLVICYLLKIKDNL